MFIVLDSLLWSIAIRRVWYLTAPVYRFTPVYTDLPNRTDSTIQSNQFPVPSGHLDMTSNLQLLYADSGTTSFGYLATPDLQREFSEIV